MHLWYMLQRGRLVHLKVSNDSVKDPQLPNMLSSVELQHCERAICSASSISCSSRTLSTSWALGFLAPQSLWLPQGTLALRVKSNLPDRYNRSAHPLLSVLDQPHSSAVKSICFNFSSLLKNSLFPGFQSLSSVFSSKLALLQRSTWVSSPCILWSISPQW